MKNGIIAIAAVAALLSAASLVGTNTVVAYEKSHAIDQVNECGNGELPLNVACENIGSQVQGKYNAIEAASDQSFK